MLDTFDPIPTEEPIEIPDKLGCVEGIRAFRIYMPGFLGAISVEHVYIPQEKQIAYCQDSFQLHNAPERDCRCGFYLVKSLALTNYTAWYRFHSYASSPVWGPCYGWGKVIEHEFGYRVQYSYPKELYSNAQRYNKHNLTEAISERYQVKCSFNPFIANYPEPKKPLSKKAEDVLDRVKALQADPVRLAKLQAILTKTRP